MNQDFFGSGLLFLVCSTISSLSCVCCALAFVYEVFFKSMIFFLSLVDHPMQPLPRLRPARVPPRVREIRTAAGEFVSMRTGVMLCK